MEQEGVDRIKAVLLAMFPRDDFDLDSIWVSFLHCTFSEQSGEESQKIFKMCYHVLHSLMLKPTIGSI